MALTKGEQANFNTLCRAVKNGDVALIECYTTIGHERVAVICAVEITEDCAYNMIPLAKLFSGDPYEELEDPTQEDDNESSTDQSA